MSNDNKEFFDLLNSIVDEQTFSLELCPREETKTVSCKQLSTAQLKELIKERRENLNFLPENHEDRKQILEIIKIYEERIRFIEIGKKDSQENK